MASKTALLFGVLILFIAFENYSFPDKTSLSGKITDGKTGETLPGVSIYFPDLKSGTVTKADGTFFIGQLPLRKILVQVSYLGYRTILVTVDLTSTKTKDFVLTIIAKEINEIMITGSSHAVEAARTPAPVSIIKRETLLENDPVNIIDALSTQPGISMISSGNAISKPVIRGLGFNRVVVVNDGIKQEGQQWGDEHGIEIDANTVSKIEILKGPSSLSFGSDALAGVINMISAPTLPEGKVSGKALFNYQTNSGLTGYSFNTLGNIKGWIYDLRYSSKKSHDYKNKYDGYVFNSRFSENAFTAITGLNRSWGFLHIHLSTYNLIPGIMEGERDSLTGKFLQEFRINDTTTESRIVTDKNSTSYDALIPNQKIAHNKAVINSSIILGNNTLKTTIGIQQNSRKEYSDVLIPTTPGLHLQLNTLNYDLKYIISGKNGNSFSMGANGMYQQSRNKGFEFLIPDYHFFDVGFYVLLKKNLGTVDLSGGIRYDRRDQHAENLFLDENENVVPVITPAATIKFKSFDALFTGFSGSAGATWQISNMSYSKLNVSSGFRCPNIAELGSNGVHEGTYRYEIGNVNLKIERSVQTDFSFGINSDHVTAELDLFYNLINNFIFLSAIQNSSGSDSTIDNFRVFNYISGDADLKGGEFLLDIHPHPFDWLHFENSFSFVDAGLKNMPDSATYLPFTPAPKFSTEIRMDAKQKFRIFINPYFRIGILNYLSQKKIYEAHNTETSTPSYTLINAGLGSEFNLNKKWKVSMNVSVNNIFDVAYQSHLSRLKYAPINYQTGRIGIFNEGRSVNFRLEVGF